MTSNKKRMTVRLPDELNKTISMEAEKQGISKNTLIIMILWEWKNNSNTSIRAQ